MMTGLNSRTFEHLQLGAGLFIKDFNPDAASTAAELKALLAQRIESGEGLLGATRGGGSFQCKPALRHIEADGLRTPVKGSVTNDGWTVKLTGTLLEITPGSFSDVLALCDTTVSGGVTTLSDVRALAGLGLYGAILGKAMYEGRLTLKDALCASGELEEKDGE